MGSSSSGSGAGFRRVFLALAGATIFGTLPTRASASDPSVALEGEVYGGQSSGEWVCGPRNVARYGGVGARVTLSERPAGASDKGAGTYGTVGVVGEYEVAEVPGHDPKQVQFGGGFSIGDRDEYFGASVGLLVYQGYDEPASLRRGPDWSSFPALEMVFGKERGLSWPLGFGSPMVSTYRRPAIVYTGPRYVAPTWKLDVLTGLYRSGAASLDTTQLRFDGTMRFRLASDFWLGPHAALADPYYSAHLPIDAELGLNAELGF